LLHILVLAALVAAGSLYWLSRPQVLAAGSFADSIGDPERGQQVYLAAGCRSCHSAPNGNDKDVLAGGQRFPSEFGTFVAPNISPDPEHGIGTWTLYDFANAVQRGVSPSGQHYYPAFPYTAYIRTEPQDMADLWAFWQTLPLSDAPNAAHEVPFPFSIRRSVGLWKRLYLTDRWILTGDLTPEAMDGRRLVEALAHCGECHTPRGTLGNLDTARWLGGAPNPTGSGTVPGLTPTELTWSASDIAYYLESGFTPDYDSAGGHMVAVVETFAELSSDARDAVASYLKALPQRD